MAVSYTHLDVYKRQDLAAILLECSVSGSVNLQDLDEYNTPARRIRITVTPEAVSYTHLDVYKRQSTPASGSSRNLLRGERESCACSGAISLPRTAS